MKHNLIIIISLIVITNIFDTIRELSLKFAVNSLELHVDSIKKAFHFLFKLVTNPLIAVTLLCSIISFFIWLFILSKVDLSFASPMDSMHYIFIAVASGILLKEKVGLGRWLGTLSIIVGIILIAFSS